MTKKRILATAIVVAVLCALFYFQVRHWRSFDWAKFRHANLAPDRTDLHRVHGAGAAGPPRRVHPSLPDRKKGTGVGLFADWGLDGRTHLRHRRVRGVDGYRRLLSVCDPRESLPGQVPPGSHHTVRTGCL